MGTLVKGPFMTYFSKGDYLKFHFWIPSHNLCQGWQTAGTPGPPKPLSMTDIANGSQLSFLLILDTAIESSQNNPPDGQGNELIPELILLCLCWSIPHWFRKPLMRASTSWGHGDTAVKDLPWLYIGICLGQSQGYSLILQGGEVDWQWLWPRMPGIQPTKSDFQADQTR